jgi:hypothetical protein
MVLAIKKMGCVPVCNRCLRRFDHVHARSTFVGWWVCSRCGDWLTDLEHAHWIRP